MRKWVERLTSWNMVAAVFFTSAFISTFGGDGDNVVVMLKLTCGLLCVVIQKLKELRKGGY